MHNDVVEEGMVPEGTGASCTNLTRWEREREKKYRETIAVLMRCLVGSWGGDGGGNTVKREATQGNREEIARRVGKKRRKMRTEQAKQNGEGRQTATRARGKGRTARVSSSCVGGSFELESRERAKQGKEDQRRTAARIVLGGEGSSAKQERQKIAEEEERLGRWRL